MKFGKRIMAAIMSLVMIIATFAVAEPVSAHLKYDPTADGNNGVYIDTRALPNNKDISTDGSQITTKRNVWFRLYCNVDCEWSIKADDDDNDSVGSNVTIGKLSGIVKIKTSADGGYYTVTAKAKNVTLVKTADIKILVNGNDKPAQISSISYDKNAVTNPQMVISDDEKTMTVNGRVSRETIPVKCSPEYVLDQKISFVNPQYDQGITNSFELSGDRNSKITTVNKTEDSIIKVTAAEEERVQCHEDLNLVIKEKPYTYKIESSEVKVSDNNQYTLSKNQYAEFAVVDNSAISLPENGISSLEWTLKQNDVDLTPDSKGVYKIKDKSEDKKVFATIKVVGKSLVVETETKGDFEKVDAIKATAKCKGINDNAGNNFSSSCTINFNTGVAASFTDAYIDFARAGLKENVDFSVKEEVLGTNKVKVYYFEANKNNLNLVDATFADISGVRTFEESKDAAFGKDEAVTVTYQLKNLEDSVFGTKESAAKYNNTDLNANELTDSDSLKKNNVFTKQGIGYKKLIVQSMTGTDEVKKNTYYIRFVSPSDKIQSDYTISYDEKNWYKLDDDEVVHVRRGESVTPGFYETIDNEWKAVDAITSFNPYIEYTISDSSVANATTDAENKVFKINGINSGLVKVKATGAVNKSNVQTFEFYVNKDIMPGNFEINFEEALAAGKVENGSVIRGKQESVPVTVINRTEGGGIPVLKWSISDKTGEYATINENTGVITTKNTCDDDITVTATDGVNTAKLTFTIGNVYASRIEAFAEKKGTSVLTSVTDTSGVCKVGNVFALTPLRYFPIEATGVEAKLKWESTDPSVAVVDANGKVTALKEGETKIRASFTSQGTKVTSDFTLSVKGFANEVTAIVANDVVLDYIGANKSINVKVLPENAPNKGLTFTSTNEAIAKVSSTGLVTGNSNGTCKIIISSIANPAITTTINVTVGNAINPNNNSGSSQTAKNVKKPGKVKGVKVKAKKKSAKVSWKKISSVAGYTVQYSLNKKFKKAKSKTLKKTSVTIKKLKKKKNYFFRVRAYRKNGSKKLTGAWSSVVKAKI